jgi:hypothetical protein
MRAILIINPVSGDGEPNEEKVFTIQKWLTSAPFVAQVCYTTKERGAGLIARDAVASGVEVVLVGGGDGTVSEVARELVYKSGTLGILPIGTFNNIAAASACRRICPSPRTSLLPVMRVRSMLGWRMTRIISLKLRVRDWMRRCSPSARKLKADGGHAFCRPRGSRSNTSLNRSASPSTDHSPRCCPRQAKRG